MIDESLFRMQKIQAMRRPTERNQNSLANFLVNTGSQVKEESNWIRMGRDLAAVAHDQEHGWLIGFLEDILLKISRKTAIVSWLFLWASVSSYCPSLFTRVLATDRIEDFHLVEVLLEDIL